MPNVNEQMNSERVFVENQKYKEFYQMCVGIDYVEWENGDTGYIYFEESTCGNRAEVFYKKMDDALVEYNESDDYFEKGEVDE